MMRFIAAKMKDLREKKIKIHQQISENKMPNSKPKELLRETRIERERDAEALFLVLCFVSHESHPFDLGDENFVFLLFYNHFILFYFIFIVFKRVRPEMGITLLTRN